MITYLANFMAGDAEHQASTISTVATLARNSLLLGAKGHAPRHNITLTKMMTILTFFGITII